MAVPPLNVPHILFQYPRNVNIPLSPNVDTIPEAIAAALQVAIPLAGVILFIAVVFLRKHLKFYL